MIRRNETLVTHGLFAGAASTVIWWALGQFAEIQTPDATTVAASVTVITGVVQWLIPKR